MVGVGPALYPDRVTTLGTGAPRWARASLLATLTVLVSVGGHALAGGTVELSLPLLLGGMALGLMCVAAADVRRSFREILAVVLLAQPVLHLLASMGAHGTHGSVEPVSAAMVLAHVGAALVVTVLLAGAERGVWTYAELLRPARLPSVAEPARFEWPTLGVDAAWSTPLVPRWLTQPLSGRGPPVMVSTP